MVYFKVLSDNLPEETEENNKNTKKKKKGSWSPGQDFCWDLLNMKQE
jgi:hypothetical protein